jgi:hypothetical protein
VPDQCHQDMSPPSDRNCFQKDVCQAYEDGKHRRYGLLFSVNGGALAIGKLIVGEAGTDRIVLGGLKVWMLGLAMAAFSGLMTYDIWQFGLRMRKFDETLFCRPGKRVLLMIGGMLTFLGLLVAIQPSQ